LESLFADWYNDQASEYNDQTYAVVLRLFVPAFLGFGAAFFAFL